MLKNYEQVAQELLPHLQSFEKCRKKNLAKKVRREFFILIYVIFVIIVSILFVEDNLSIPIIPIPYPFILGLAAIIFYALLDYHQTEIQIYHRKFKGKIVAIMMKTANPELSYAKNEYISQNVFHKSYLFLRGVDRYKGKDYIKGRIGKTNFEFSGVHAEYGAGEDERYSNDASEILVYNTIFKGLFIKADFHKHFYGKIYLKANTDKQYLNTLFKYINIPFECLNTIFPFTEPIIPYGNLITLKNPLFEKEFTVYSHNNKSDIESLAIQNLLESVFELKQTLNIETDIRIAFIEKNVYIAIPNLDIFQIDIKHSLLEQEHILRCYTKLRMCLNIIDSLNLNTRLL